MTLQMSESYVRTIVRALAHERTHDAWQTLLELERQGVSLPPWIYSEGLR